MTDRHHLKGYEIHPVFFDLLEGLKFDLLVGESINATRSNVHARIDHEKFRQYADPTKPNLIRPYN